MKKYILIILLSFCILKVYTHANNQITTTDLTATELGMIRTFQDLTHLKQQTNRQFVIAVLDKDKEIPEWDLQDDVDYFIIFTNGKPQTNPHTSTMHFEFVSYTLESNIALYMATDPKAPKTMYSKPCWICERLNDNVLEER